MNSPLRRVAGKGTLIVIFAATAVAAFGVTFHFFGSSAIVPEPSREFGFFLLSPVAVIDRIYSSFNHNRLIWQPLPMFLVLWTAYAFATMLAFYFFNRRKTHSAV